MRKFLYAAGAAVIAILLINYKTTSTETVAGFDSVNNEVMIAEAQGAIDDRVSQDNETQLDDTEVHPKVSLLRNILNTKNDNDPRLDTEFRNLSVEEKAALISMYEQMRPESLNERGTIVFLMGREITRPEDAEFLKRVLSEEPCLSLSNCGVPNAQRDPHMDSVNDTTLSYPQLVALNRIKSFVSQRELRNVNPTILSHLADAAKIGQNSRIPLVQARANEIVSILETRN